MTNPNIIFTAPNMAEVIDKPIPAPGRGQVLVRTARTCISSGTERTNLIGDPMVGPDVKDGAASSPLAAYPSPTSRRRCIRFPTRKPSSPASPPDSILDGVPILTEEQVWADKTIDAAFVEVTNCDLIPVAERVLAHELPMHLDKPGGESYERYAKFRTEAKARGIHVQMGYMFRANPAIQWLITAVREGVFG